jgi:murein DD-endopeptidase MepM/ murein hydrolase activator NlpD
MNIVTKKLCQLICTLFTSQNAKSISAEEALDTLSSVSLKPSMSISIPKIDATKIHAAIPLGNDEGSLKIKEELRDHGYSDKEIAEMDLGDYQELCASWIMSPTRIEVAKEIYPELANKDLTKWTNGEYDNFIKEKNLETFIPTQSQSEALEARDITLDDAIWLTKIYGSFDDILEQSDNVLKAHLEERYQFIIDNIIKQAEMQLGISATLDPNLYVQVASFAGYRYNDDWFLKSVSTHDPYWRSIQEQRTLKAFRALYKYTSSSLPTYYTTNLYGTYSVSQKGAHEGIDFAYGGTGTTIYNIATGKVRAPKSTHSDHHLCIYDEGTNKSYSYLHMNKITVSVGEIFGTVGNEVGQQGMKGNATGPHVHFEVHSGNTDTLSPENDNVLQSISPYQMQVFLGE